MLYAVLCYHDENLVWSWSKEEEDALMGKIGAVRGRLTAQGKLGASLRLMPTTAATTLHKTQEPPLVIDGPFAETKELIAGFWMWQVKSREEAIEWLKRAPFDGGTEVEIRQVFETADFAPSDPTGDLRAAEDRLRSQIAAKK